LGQNTSKRNTGKGTLRQLSLFGAFEHSSGAGAFFGQMGQKI